MYALYIRCYEYNEGSGGCYFYPRYPNEECQLVWARMSINGEFHKQSVTSLWYYKVKKYKTLHGAKIAQAYYERTITQTLPLEYLGTLQFKIEKRY